MPARRSNTNVRAHLEDVFHTIKRILEQRENLGYRDFQDLRRLMMMSDAILRVHTTAAAWSGSRRDVYVERSSR